MESLNLTLLVAGGLITASVVASVGANRLGLPLLIVFLAAGMLAGEDGPGGIVFDDFAGSYVIGNLALATILLDGGLRTDRASFRVALGPAAVLATWGVLATAALVGGFATWLFELDWRYGMLLGSIVASTDAAAVFSLLRHSGLNINERVRATLEIESGTNDPLAIFLVVALIGLLTEPRGAGLGGLVLDLLSQMGFGLALGFAGGAVLAHALERLRLPEGLYALLIVAGGLTIFGATNELGGSGFLAIYLAGLMVGDRHSPATEHVKTVLDGLAWLAQAVMFVILGLLVTPSRLVDSLPEAALVALFLMLVARPLAVVSGLAPGRFPWREQVFIAWVGLRGAVPVVLAIFPVVAGLPDSRLIFDVTFTVVLVSLLLQGMTLARAARRCGVVLPHRVEPLERQPLWLATRPHELVAFRVEPGAPAVGRRTLEPLLESGGAALRCLFVERAGQALLPAAELRLAAEDRAWLLLAPDQASLLATLFCGAAYAGEAAARDFFGDFTLNGTAPAGDLAAVYGLELAAEETGLGLGEVLERRLGRRAVVGDGVRVGPLRLVAREIEGGVIVKVGLQVAPPPTP